jgi:hypothetical protein
MKLKGIRIDGYKLKDGALSKSNKTPAPLRKGKHAKAARAEKAWKAKSK